MKTVKVRIAVMVNAQGEWSAHGFHGADDDYACGIAKEGLEETKEEAFHFVVATIPLPAVQVPLTIKGKVE